MKKIVILLFVIILFQSSGYNDSVKVGISSPVLPVLTGKKTNPVLRVEMIRQRPEDYSLQKIVISLEGTTDLNDIERISLFKSGSEGRFATATPIGESQSPAPIVTFKDNFNVTEDTIMFWVSVTLKGNIDLTHRIKAQCKSISTDIGDIRVPAAHTQSLRVGVAVRRYMQDGVRTSRIPGLATSKNGTLLAIFDARYESWRDLQGHMDIGLNRSTDGGRTWKPIQIVLDMKEWGGLPQKYNGVSDACILVDDNTGDIYVAGLWMHGVLDERTGKWVEGMTEDSTRWIHQWHAKGSQPGFGVKETSQFLITKSTDDGLTWSDPVNITSIKKKEWWLFAPAPGHGITLADGTLVFPTQGRDETGEPFSNITWSKDRGKTWTTNNPAHKNTTECMAVQLSDESVMLNMRDNRNAKNKEVNGRTIATTADLGETWKEHHTSRKALMEPVCMASLHKHVYHENGVEKSVLLFSNPASVSRRDNITLKVSHDDGNTWPQDKHILLDEYSGNGYSCITSVNDSTIGILYESSQAQMVFQTVSLREIQ